MLQGWLQRGQLKHQIAARLLLSQIEQAHQMVQQGGEAGKVVLRIP